MSGTAFARDVLAAYADRINLQDFDQLDGKPMSGSGRGTTALRWVSDRWWIVHEHLSRYPG